MSQRVVCGGAELRDMFAAATVWLERNAREIDSLNVFPVPDGDTGTNMVLTMKAAMEEASRCPEQSASAVLQAMAWGALMGARGNSGVILAQIMRGLAQELEGRESVAGPDFAAALAHSSTLAYKAVSQPVEGTILTVVREAAASVQSDSLADGSDLRSIMEALVAEARASVAKTPSLLPVLRRAGVVDAGGQGLYVLLEGALRYLRGEEAGEIARQPMAVAGQKEAEEPLYGYCTEFLIRGSELNMEQIRNRLCELGESVLVIGDQSTVRAHLHTLDPGAALSYATSLGELHQVKVDNMEEQHREFITQRASLEYVPLVSTVAVASGEGLSQVLASLGAIILPGGETMNPSVQELLRAVDSAPADKVIILPNNPEIFPAVAQVQSLAGKEVAAVPSKSIPQGIAALLAFNSENDLETNLETMQHALSTVRTGELTTAVRSMKWDRLEVRRGQAIAFLDGDLVAAGDTMPEAMQGLLSKIGVDHNELVTIYYGAEAPAAEVEEIAHSIRSRYPRLGLEIVAGGQPHYNYIVSVE